MLITLKDGYVYSFALVGEIDGGIIVEKEPEDMDHFFENSEAYKLVDGALVYDEDQNKQIIDAEIIDELRQRREKECFSVINRGQAWYNSLSSEQSAELQEWYQAWLNVTETKEIPEKPDWI